MERVLEGNNRLDKQTSDKQMVTLFSQQGLYSGQWGVQTKVYEPLRIL